MKKYRRHGICAILCAAALALLALHPPVSSQDLDPFFSTLMTDRNGVVLREIPSPNGTCGRFVPIGDISPYLVAATVIAEDKNFWWHFGVDPTAVVRSFVQNVRAGKIVSGASTIPQQLIRIAKHRPRTALAKLQTMAESVWLTISLSKEKQLEAYLSIAPYGGDSAGVAEAAKRYFRASPKNLTLAQSAFLAVIPRSPAALDPARNFRAVRERQRLLLRRMRDAGAIERPLFEQAMAEEIQVEPSPVRPFLAPHFTEHVRRSFDLGGAREVQTSLDAVWQGRIEQLVRRHLERAAPYRIQNAAVIVIDHATRAARAWVGSQEYTDEAHDGAVDGVLARRQPGSALKPFLYALALRDGMTAATVLPDVRTHYVLDDHEYYIPRNYNKEYRGPVRLREALAGSLNVPAVYVAKLVGPARIEDLFNRMGFGLSQAPWHYGLGIALGNPEVRLVDLAGAYAALASGGRWRPVEVFSSEHAAVEEQVIPPGIAAILVDILSDTDARDRFFGMQNPFHFEFPVAVKTGTSGNWRDNWSFGSTRDATVGVWVGNFDAQPMQGTSGATGAGPLLREVVEFVAAQYPPREEILSKRELAEAAICPLSGMKAGPHCPSRTAEYFIPGMEPQLECDWHRLVEIDRRNGLLAAGRCPREQVEEEEGVVFPPEFREWAIEHGVGVHRPSPLCRGEASVGRIAVTYPKPGAKFLVDPSRHREFQSIPLKVDVEGNPRAVEWVVDGDVYQTVNRYPFFGRLQLSPGRHTLIARSDGKESEEVSFEVK